MALLGMASPEQLSIPATWLSPSQDRLKLIVDVNAILLRNARILLGRRCNTDFEDGSYHLPAGHLEGLRALYDEARGRATAG